MRSYVAAPRAASSAFVLSATQCTSPRVAAAAAAATVSPHRTIVSSLPLIAIPGVVAQSGTTAPLSHPYALLEVLSHSYLPPPYRHASPQRRRLFLRGRSKPLELSNVNGTRSKSRYEVASETLDCCWRCWNGLRGEIKNADRKAWKVTEKSSTEIRTFARSHIYRQKCSPVTAERRCSAATGPRHGETDAVRVQFVSVVVSKINLAPSCKTPTAFCSAVSQ